MTEIETETETETEMETETVTESESERGRESGVGSLLMARGGTSAVSTLLFSFGRCTIEARIPTPTHARERGPLEMQRGGQLSRLHSTHGGT